MNSDLRLFCFAVVGGLLGFIVAPLIVVLFGIHGVLPGFVTGVITESVLLYGAMFLALITDPA